MRTRISRYVTAGANLVGRPRQASEVETSGNCGVTGDKDGCATLVQSASKTSVCRYYSRHPLLHGGNKKKSVPRSHWVYASRIWRPNVSRSAPDLFADDRVLLSYLAITDDIGRIFFFSSNGRKFIAVEYIGSFVFCFLSSKAIRSFLIEAIILEVQITVFGVFRIIVVGIDNYKNSLKIFLSKSYYEIGIIIILLKPRFKLFTTLLTF